MSRRGQSLVELAVCLPVVLVLVLGGVALARVADARAGLDAATAAAAAEAGRAADPTTAAAVGQTRFAAIVAAYPLQAAALSLDLGTFERATLLTAEGSATVDLSFLPVPGLPRTLTLASRAAAVIEPWRARPAPPCGQDCQADNGP